MLLPLGKDEFIAPVVDPEGPYSQYLRTICFPGIVLRLGKMAPNAA